MSTPHDQSQATFTPADQVPTQTFAGGPALAQPAAEYRWQGDGTQPRPAAPAGTGFTQAQPGDVQPPDGDKRDTHGSRVFTENGRSATVSPGDHITAVTYYNSYLKTGKFTLRIDVSRPGADPVTYYQTTDIPAGA